MRMTQSNSKPTALHLREMIVQAFDYLHADFASGEQQELRSAIVKLTRKYFPQENQKGEKKHAKKQTRRPIHRR